MQRSAFSLIELSIVLIILGLLVGGILTGQNLIRAAGLRKITTEREHYHIALTQFKDKYFALPGDMDNATRFWGAAHATAATCITTIGTGTQTCNGDGNGIIKHSAGGPLQRSEGYMFWEHLVNAGIITGGYTGMSGSSGSTHDIPEENVPTSGLSSNGGWNIEEYGGMFTAYNGIDFNTYYGINHFEYGSYDSTADHDTDAPIITNAEAYNIDQKLDDGMPGRGKVMPRPIGPCTNAADEDDLDAQYNLQENGIECSLTFLW